MKPYTLSQAELTAIMQLVDEGTFSQQVRWGKNNRQHAINGLAAEYAFCQLFNTFFKWGQTNKDEGDTIYKGEVVDVKQNGQEWGDLIACPHKIDAPATVYALVVGVAPGPFLFKGFAHKKDLFLSKNIKNFGYGERFFLSQKDLTDEV